MVTTQTSLPSQELKISLKISLVDMTHLETLWKMMISLEIVLVNSSLKGIRKKVVRPNNKEIHLQHLEDKAFQTLEDLTKALVALASAADSVGDLEDLANPKMMTFSTAALEGLGILGSAHSHQALFQAAQAHHQLRPLHIHKMGKQLKKLKRLQLMQEVRRRLKLLKRLWILMAEERKRLTK